MGLSGGSFRAQTHFDVIKSLPRKNLVQKDSRLLWEGVGDGANVSCQGLENRSSNQVHPVRTSLAGTK